MDVLESNIVVGTPDDLRRKLRSYELAYQVDTSELLNWFETADARLDRIPDAGFWRSTHRILMRLLQEEQGPTWTRQTAEVDTRGSKGAPSSLYGPCRVCSFA
jgi:hypothetical protein